MLRRVFMLVLLLAALGWGGTGTALAACSGTGCNYQDPAAAGCAADGVTLESFRYSGVLFELRYSRRCNAAWTRTTGGSSPNCSWWAASIGSQIQGNGTYSAGCATGGQRWTGMLSFTYDVRACATAAPAGQEQRPVACSRWR